MPKAYAASDQINIYPSISGAQDAGWHFDEGTSDFAAQDFGGTGGAVLYASMVQSSGVAWDYYVSSPSSCKVHAILRYWNGSQWINTPGSEMHYLHLSSVQTGQTPWAMQTAGQNVWMSVGIIATSGACTFGDPHVHLSGDFSSSSYLVRVNRTNETCWSNTTSRCSSSTYTRRHTADSLCPPSTPEYFTSTISGNVSTYICETWSVKTHPQSARQMRIRW